ncbi:MAG TPA: helix-turn-helix domain-containing protein [Dehalococcoidia bacterium]|nr:helix-turn-helix domain-containing protein [Dehalococcoidia bacterium]
MTEQNKPTPVMEVAVERSFDILEKSWQSRVFTKLYHSLRTSGLLAKLSDKDFRTLICLSTFMDAQGRCFPSQQALAQALGISRAAVSKRMKSLLSFQWQGKPVVSARKVRGDKGIFENTVYTILPQSSLRIFDNDANRRGHVNTSHVAGGHTNQTQTDNKILNAVTEQRLSEIDPLALELARDMGDTHNLAYYRKLVRQLPASILLRARGEVLEEKNIRRSKGAMFAYLVKKHMGHMS